ncbi:MAG: hypothetical protein N2234_08920 [Planctomycetota bacterium]|nr:hypothetical protein [Planctomycetota bacterium]
MALEVILAPIRRLKLLIALCNLSYGLAWLILVALGCAFVTLLFDWAAPLPAVMRLILSILSFALIVYVFIKLVVSQALKRLSDDAVALAIEEKYPQLKSALISSIQLVRYGENEGFFNSEELVKLTLEKTAHMVKEMRFQGVANIIRPLKVWLLVALVMFASGLYISNYPEVANLWFLRFFSPFSAPSWPKYYRLKIENHPKVIAKGDNLEITVLSIGRRDPEVVTIYSKSENQDYWESSSMQKYGAKKFIKKFENVVEPLMFFVEGGDAREPESGYIRVDVRTRPFIKQIAFWIHPPAYTNLPKTPPDKPIERSSLSVVENSEVEFEATASQPLRYAELVNITNISGENLFSSDRLTDGIKFRGRLRALKSVSFYFKLTDKEGFDNFTNHKPETFTLNVSSDSLPDIKFELPGRSLRMSEKGVLPIRIRVKDDYGIKDVKLIHYCQKEQEKHIKTEPKTIAFEEKSYKEQREVVLEYSFDVEKETKAKPGDEVVYYAQAWDFCETHTKPAESSYFRITIVTVEELENDYTRMISRMRESLLDILKKQTIVRDSVHSLGEEIASKKKQVSDETRSELRNYEAEQRDITSRLRLCEETVSSVVEGMQMNRIGTKESFDYLKDLGERLGTLATTLSPEAARKLNELRENLNAPSLDTRFADVVVTQDEIIAKIREIVDLATKWTTVAEFVARLRKIIEGVTRIREEISKTVTKPK